MAEMFTFRMRAYAAAHFEWGDVLAVTWPYAEAKLESEYTGGDDGRAYAVTIHGEIRGEGESLDEAEPRLGQAISSVLPVLALASNAAIADPLAVVAHGVDLTEPQPFRGYRTPKATEWFPPGKRSFDAEATLALMEAVGRNPQTDLLHRAIEAYRRALGHWIPEQRLMAGEFLFIAAETLSRFLVESRASSRGITPKNLARLMKVNSPDALRWQYLSDEIFAADADARKAMDEASNGFEHGYMAVDQVRGLLEPVLERSMGHVRRGLIAASGVTAELESRLLADKFTEPRGLVPEISFVRGRLMREDSTLPPPPMGGGDVEFEWGTLVPVATRTPGGDVNISFTWQVSPTLPPNTTLELSGFGMRAAYMKPTGQPAEIKVRRAGEPPPEPSEDA